MKLSINNDTMEIHVAYNDANNDATDTIVSCMKAVIVFLCCGPPIKICFMPLHSIVWDCGDCGVLWCSVVTVVTCFHHCGDVWWKLW